jgi:UDP-N-acetylmuramate--alanine ligase
MSHTYSRTAALLDEFAAAFDAAGVLFLHKIYASAREKYEGGVTGKTLYEKIKNIRSAGGTGEVYYIDEPLDALEPVKKILKNGDLFITLGAGNNWPLGLALFNSFQKPGGGGKR